MTAARSTGSLPIDPDPAARLTPSLGLVPAIYVPVNPAPAAAHAVGRILHRVAHRVGAGA